MTGQQKLNHQAMKRRRRVRGKLQGTMQRPRLTVFRSNKNTYLQVIDDVSGKTVACANNLMAAKQKQSLTGSKIERAQQLAQELATQLKAQKITKLAFDRGSYRYHGRLKAVADTLRSAGIEV